MLSRDFLSRIAKEYGCSPEQEEVFILRFAENKSYEDIADELGITKDAAHKRMSLVYAKLGIEGDSKGKEGKCRVALMRIARQSEQLQPITTIIEEKQPSILHQAEVSNLKRQFAERDDLILVGESITRTIEPKFITKLTNPSQWIRDLRERLAQEQNSISVQQALREISEKLLEVIERVAATSRRTELEITLELMEQIELVLDKEVSITWREWLEKPEAILDQLNWQTVDSLKSILESSRSRIKQKTGLTRGKVIKVAGNEDQSIVLLVEIKPENDELFKLDQPINPHEEIEVIFQVRPPRNSVIPNGLILEILDQNGEILNEVKAEDHPLLELSIICGRGEELSVMLSWNRWRIAEKIIIPD